MTPGDWFVLWIGLQEGVAGIIYAISGQPWKAVAWIAYGLACVGLALAGK